MAEKKSQTLVRVGPDELSQWKEAATIRGLSLNQWIVDAANRNLVTSNMEAFAKSAVAEVASADPLVAFDLALSQTPILTGTRKWVDPISLREEFERLLKPDGTQ